MTEPRPFEVIEGSVYIGRKRLGRFAQTQRKRFEGYDALDRLLGAFSTRAEALVAIGEAARR